jgi:hypothetical protein
MIRHVPLIRSEPVRHATYVAQRPEMYDDHLLAWMSHLQELRGALTKPQKNRPKPVESDRGEWFPCVRAAGQAMGVSPDCIRVAVNRHHTSAGRKWQYSRFSTETDFKLDRRRVRIHGKPQSVVRCA